MYYVLDKMQFEFQAEKKRLTLFKYLLFIYYLHVNSPLCIDKYIHQCVEFRAFKLIVKIKYDTIDMLLFFQCLYPGGLFNL